MLNFRGVIISWVMSTYFWGSTFFNQLTGRLPHISYTMGQVDTSIFFYHIRKKKNRETISELSIKGCELQLKHPGRLTLWKTIIGFFFWRSFFPLLNWGDLYMFQPLIFQGVYLHWLIKNSLPEKNQTLDPSKKRGPGPLTLFVRRGSGISKPPVLFWDLMILRVRYPRHPGEYLLRWTVL